MPKIPHVHHRNRVAADALVDDLLDHPSESERRTLKLLPSPRDVALSRGERDVARSLRRFLDPLLYTPTSFVQALVARGDSSNVFPRRALGAHRVAMLWRDVFSRSSLGAHTFTMLWWLAEGPVFPVETRRIPFKDLERLVSGPPFDVEPIWAMYPQDAKGDVLPDPLVSFAREELQQLYGQQLRGLHIRFPPNESTSRKKERTVLEVERCCADNRLSRPKAFSKIARDRGAEEMEEALKQAYYRARRELKE